MSPGRLAQLEAGDTQPSQDETRLLGQALALDDTALWDIVAGWRPESVELAPYTVDTVRFPPMQSNGYVVTGPDIEGAVLVDPGGSPEQLIALCEAAGGLQMIWLTHTHFDHIEALPEVARHFPHAPVLVHASGADQLGIRPELKVVEGHSTVRAHGLTIDVLAAPGHSDDGILIRLGNMVFVGDTLFAGSLGRSAAGPATYDTLLNSAGQLLSMPDSTILLPGHGPITTVGWERTYNPFLALRK